MMLMKFDINSTEV